MDPEKSRTKSEQREIARKVTQKKMVASRGFCGAYKKAEKAEINAKSRTKNWKRRTCYSNLLTRYARESRLLPGTKKY